MRSRENNILRDVRANDSYRADYKDVAVRGCYDYLTDAFGTTALNDGIYTPAEIEHATKVLGRLIRLGETQ